MSVLSRTDKVTDVDKKLEEPKKPFDHFLSKWLKSIRLKPKPATPTGSRSSQPVGRCRQSTWSGWSHDAKKTKWRLFPLPLFLSIFFPIRGGQSEFFFTFMQIKEAAFLIVAEVSPKKILQKCFYFLFSDFQTSRTITTNVFPLRTYFFLVQQHLMTFKNVLEQSKKY